jgi:hypothetical protein
MYQIIQRRGAESASIIRLVIGIIGGEYNSVSSRHSRLSSQKDVVDTLCLYSYYVCCDSLLVLSHCHTLSA